MRIGVPKEVYAGEERVATTPDVATQLMKLGFDVSVESGAGKGSNFSDSAYSEVGCEVVDSTGELWSKSDIVLKVRRPKVMSPRVCGPTRRSSVSSGLPRIRSCSSS